MKFAGRLLLAILGSAVAEAAAAPPAGSPDAPAGIEFFEARVRPLLAQHCQKCHGAKKQESGLRLDSAAALARGSDNGPVVAAGDPAASKMIVAVNYADENLQMPPGGKLPPDAIDTLTQWVKLGSPWPADPAARASDVTAWKRHWAFQPVVDPSLPAVKQPDWVRSPIDAFVLARLEQAGFGPAQPADRRTLLRRASFDLIGLPPTPAEVEAFEADASADAFAKVVDRLLASPHYGERWGRHWLDYARYADSKGYVFMEDRKYPLAYKYRDWVVKALNDDLPYDQFLIQQIAADRLPATADHGHLAALGFVVLGRRFLNNPHDIIDDRIDTLCRTTLGLTVTCARCHDHKFDPIGTKDYYALYGVFASSVEPKEPADVMSLADAPEPHNVRVFVRGNAQNQGEEAPRRFLPCLSTGEPPPFTQGSGRLELAQAIANRDNPLTARVLVNRVWGHYFGAGLVRTPSDFGLRSEPPTHPELLDFLARRFMDQGWSLKALHRLIVLSNTYQQASQLRPECQLTDPENRLVWRMSRRRLDLEGLRDAMLDVSGTLDRSVGGPSVDLTTLPFTHRRTIYGLIERQNLPGLFRSFDFAGPDTHSPTRFTTTVPQQALFLMNSPFVGELSKSLAGRSEVLAAREPRERIEIMYRLILGRAPTEDEARWALEFVSPAALPVAAGSFGYGDWDEATGQVKNFSQFPHWAAGAWQGGPVMPDPKLGWLNATADGGHPGAATLAVVRRWSAPADGTVTIEGALEHPSPHGNGVAAYAVSSRHGIVGRWVAEHNRAETRLERVAVQRGDTLDFVVTSRGDVNYDSFAWAPEIRLAPASPGGTELVWSAQASFHGPLPAPPNAWPLLAQTLMLTNEFVFLD